MAHFYIPKGVRCPMELSTYFRINAQILDNERTLIIADEESYGYLEGRTPYRDENQLHAAVVEILAAKGAEVKYSPFKIGTLDKNGKGVNSNFVTKEEFVSSKIKD